MLDPFLGIGNSAVAAQRCGVTKFIGFEIDEELSRGSQAATRSQGKPVGSPMGR